MDNTNESYTMYDEDDLQELLDDIKAKVVKAWHRGYQAEVRVDMSFVEITK